MLQYPAAAINLAVRNDFLSFMQVIYHMPDYLFHLHRQDRYWL